MGEIDNKIGFRLHRLDMEVKKALDTGMKNAGYDEVTLMHGWILRYLYENREKDVYQRDIEKAFSIGRSTVTTIIQLMEKRELIRRESVASDARLKKVILTEKGYLHHDHAIANFNEVHARMLKDISEEEKEILLDIIDRIEGGLKC